MSGEDMRERLAFIQKQYWAETKERNATHAMMNVIAWVAKHQAYDEAIALVTQYISCDCDEHGRNLHQDGCNFPLLDGIIESLKNTKAQV